MAKKKNEPVTPVTEEKPVVVEETVTVEPEIVEEPQVTEEPVVAEEPEAAIGVVVNCAKLNVREHPSIDSKALCTLPVSTEATVFVDEKFDGWYHVFTSTGVEGYCVKRYISIKP